MDYPEYIERLEAAKIIAELTYENRKKREYDLPNWKKIINQRIRDRIKKGALLLNDDGLLHFGKVADTFRRKYSDELASLPNAPNSGTLNALCFAYGSAMKGYAIPDGLTECQELIRTLYAENDQLKIENNRLKAELASVKPDAEKWLSFQRSSGKKTHF